MDNITSCTCMHIHPNVRYTHVHVHKIVHVYVHVRILLFSTKSCIRESVDSPCRDDTDGPTM